MPRLVLPGLAVLSRFSDGPHRSLMPRCDVSGVSTPRVLLADGHPFYRQRLAKLLAESGVEVVAEAGNGWAALKAAEAASREVVVLDLNMLGFWGAEVTGRLTSWDRRHG